MKEKFGVNLADAVASIQGQLTQLKTELGEKGVKPASLADRVDSMINAICQIAPEVA